MWGLNLHPEDQVVSCTDCTSQVPYRFSGIFLKLSETCTYQSHLHEFLLRGSTFAKASEYNNKATTASVGYRDWSLTN